MPVEIRGDGIAAWCCARLLATSGIEFSIERGTSKRRPWILISDPVQRLLCEIVCDADLFRGVPRIRRRNVRWGGRETCVEHSASIVDESSFLDRLWGALPAVRGAERPSLAVVCESRGLQQIPFGSRMARVARVRLRGAREECWIESFEDGWLFLIAADGEIGSLIMVGSAALDASQWIAPHIAEVLETQEPVAAYPRILDPLFGPDWIACGSAAMGLDPLCGDGSGHAVREAILAAAVVRGGVEAEMMDHYQARLRIAFERHVSLCRGFYVSGNSGPWWDREIADLDRGLEWTRRRAVSQWRYRLEGLDLKLLRG